MIHHFQGCSHLIQSRLRWR